MLVQKWSYYSMRITHLALGEFGWKRVCGAAYRFFGKCAGSSTLEGKNALCAPEYIPGCGATRVARLKIMRYATHAGRIRRGVPIFVTWSPDEKHNVLMLRLSRARRNDPLRQENRNFANTKSSMTQNALQIGEL